MSTADANLGVNANQDRTPIVFATLSASRHVFLDMPIARATLQFFLTSSKFKVTCCIGTSWISTRRIANKTFCWTLNLVQNVVALVDYWHFMFSITSAFRFFCLQTKNNKMKWALEWRFHELRCQWVALKHLLKI